MKLADYLAERRITPAQFAQRIHAHRSTVSRWLQPGSNARPSWDQLTRIYEATGGLVSANDFMPDEAGARCAAAGAADAV
jgi:transcriptional regulator with XRE-family HTH domain